MQWNEYRKQMNNLTLDEQELCDEIATDLDDVRSIIKISKVLKEMCEHKYVLQVGDEDCSSAICSVCGKDLGWWCPDSPNNVCEYYGNHRGGRLIGRQWEFTGEWTDEDDCIYCHQPEERK